MISPGYSYQKAPDQQHFLERQPNQRPIVFQDSEQSGSDGWQFNQSPLFLTNS